MSRHEVHTAELAGAGRAAARRLLPPLAAAALLLGPGPALSEEAAGRKDGAAIRQEFAKEGVAVELRITPLDGTARHGAVRAHEDARIEFAITDAATGAPLRGLRPAAWMDIRQGAGRDARGCTDKVGSYVGGRLTSRPRLDLNAWYLLALNDRASISVIDPLIDFGTTRTLAMVPLDGPGEDWALTGDGDRLFVTLPAAGQVAVVDTGRWQVAAEVAAGPRPGRAVLQPDGRYLWVANDAAAPGEGGVTVIDTATNEVAARLRTGGGRHDVALSADDRYAAVTNSADGTVSIIDVRELAKGKEIATGGRPVSVAYSARAGAFYVANAATGEILAIDADGLGVRARVPVAPGLAALRISPDGRWAFAVNRDKGVVYILDTATDEVRHEVAVGAEPDHVAFSEGYAYVRALGGDRVSLINLAELGAGGGEPPVVDIPAGQAAPGTDPASVATASPIVAAPQGGAALIASPRDGVVYYYMEGMAAPMGSLRNFRRQPRAVAVVDRGLRETEPGVYATTARLPAAGAYEVAFLLDSPRIVHCFDATVRPNPAAGDAAEARRPRLEYLVDDREVAAGEEVKLRFRLTAGADGASAQDRPADVRVLNVLVPGTWRQRVRANPVGDGVYEAPISVPRRGVYHVYVEAPSLGLTYRDLPHLSLRGRQQKMADGR